MSGQGSGGNVLAAICSFFIPGLGQLVQGRFWAAVGFFLMTIIGYGLYFLVIPWIVAAIFHLWAIINAARYTGKGN